MIRKLFFISTNGTISLTNGTRTFFWFLNSSIISKLFFSFSKFITFPIVSNSSLFKVLTSRFISSNKWNSSFFNLVSVSVFTRILNFFSCSAWFLVFIPWILTTKVSFPGCLKPDVSSIFEGGSFSFCNHLIPGFKNLSSKSLRDLTFTCPLIPVSYTHLTLPTNDRV